MAVEIEVEVHVGGVTKVGVIVEGAVRGDVRAAGGAGASCPSTNQP